MNKIRIKAKEGKRAKTLMYKHYVNDLFDKSRFHFTLKNGKDITLFAHEFSFVVKVILDA